MDTLFWKNLNPNLNLESSIKKYFNKFYYKLVIYAPGCKSIRSPDINKDIEFRKQWMREYNVGSWYAKKFGDHMSHLDVGFLYSLQDLLYEYPDIKIRIDEPYMSIYTMDETMIQSVAQSIDPDFRNNIKTLSGPPSDLYKDALRNNVILVKKEPKFKYRVFFKEKQFELNTRQQILNYLLELGNIVKLTDHTKSSLQKGHNWIWGCYFYTNDKNISEMIRLIHPDIVREVSEFVCFYNK